MIYEITDQYVIQTCASCKTMRKIPISDLQVGYGDGESVMPYGIRMPDCKCGATEFLFKTWDDVPEGLRSHFKAQHRMAVNALFDLLVSKGQIHEPCKDAISKDTRTTPLKAELGSEPFRVNLPQEEIAGGRQD